MSGSNWLVGDLAAAAADRILDAAGRCFAEQGVRATSMTDIAAAAGCSRPTVYRYFPDRDALRTAFVHREARKVGGEVGAAVASIDDPGERLVVAVLTAVRAVRRNPTLAAWFGDDGSVSTAGIAATSDVVGAIAAAFLGTSGDPADEQGRWLVRVTMSLLAFPGQDDEDERRMLERFVAPVLAGDLHRR